ncbi:MAG: response regulator transcription factor [Acidobacteriota bacterium]
MRILIVDDHSLFRDSLKGLIETYRGGNEVYDVVGVAGSGEEALDVARAERPDIILMDLAMPGIGGLEATRRLKAEVPGVSVVVLTSARRRSPRAPRP